MPVDLITANEFVRVLHRHHKPALGHRFSLGVANESLRGVAIVGRPVARLLDDGLTLEVTRVCTDGTKNACSMLYGAACRAAKALGYKRVVTYTLESESGAEQVCARRDSSGLLRPRIDNGIRHRGRASNAS